MISFFTCILPDHVGHESPKDFLKDNRFKNKTAEVSKLTPAPWNIWFVQATQSNLFCPESL